MVQWLRLYAPNAAGIGLIPGEELKSYCMVQPKKKKVSKFAIQTEKTAWVRTLGGVAQFLLWCNFSV